MWGSPTLIDLTNLTRATRYRWYRVASFCPERRREGGGGGGVEGCRRSSGREKEKPRSPAEKGDGAGSGRTGKSSSRSEWNQARNGRWGPVRAGSGKFRPGVSGIRPGTAGGGRFGPNEVPAPNGEANSGPSEVPAPNGGASSGQNGFRPGIQRYRPPSRRASETSSGSAANARSRGSAARQFPRRSSKQ